MISKIHFFLTPYFREKLLNQKEIEDFLNQQKIKSLSPSLVFIKNKVTLDSSFRNSKSVLLNDKKLETKLFNFALKKIQTFEKTISKDECGKIEILQLAAYQKGEFFNWHTDTYPSSRQTHNRILTIIVSLSDYNEYTGGNLEMIDYNQNLIKLSNLQKGETVIFPSDYLHRVTPVHHGIRQSLTAWLVGDGMTGMHLL